MGKVKLITGEIFDIEYYDTSTKQVGIKFVSEKGFEYDLKISYGYYEFIK